MLLLLFAHLVVRCSCETQGEIGIYALQASDGYLFENIKVVKSSPYWSLENQYYWPQAGSLTFYGYFPLASQTNGISISKNSDSVPRIRY